MDGLSDEAVCARCLDSPYVQLFCGETQFQHRLPLDRASLTRWRKRIGPERLELLLAWLRLLCAWLLAARHAHLHRAGARIAATIPSAVPHQVAA